MYSVMSFENLFQLQDEMIKARVDLCVENFQLKKGTSLHKEILKLKGMNICKLTDKAFVIKHMDGVYIVINYQ